jgi:hypothetical protein
MQYNYPEHIKARKELERIARENAAALEILQQAIYRATSETAVQKLSHAWRYLANPR